ncbi:MAG: DUF4282 domain-containing protein [Candidatus Cloacimonetes bacterium]|nr:DUF4282 domain-containing protein [Candidatus Cloacimonadota bacterium]MCF7814963.1 DUF4282 domain-containing protein [Candidatus Cloacimonadota bacterium]MCF7868424.1 DUF4282 domain-containing protein [Candidatus Cloacimonadota bacterium]MCF7883897.1 DUF4282 domain-containing protein [Candidatus Cloacimonadota bacterium]
MEEKKGFLGALFDFSFSEFITTKVIKFLFILGVVISIILAIGFIVAGFNMSTALGILFLILSPLCFLIYVILIRIWLEIIIVVFKIAENTTPRI